MSPKLLNLNDKYLWKFEAIMLLNGVITFLLFYTVLHLLGIIYDSSPDEFYDFIIFICFANIISGFITWTICKKHWIKLAIGQILIANFTLFLIMIILCNGKIDEAALSIILIFIIICCLSSIFPTLFCCYLYKKITSRPDKIGR